MSPNGDWQIKEDDSQQTPIGMIPEGIGGKKPNPRQELFAKRFVEAYNKTYAVGMAPEKIEGVITMLQECRDYIRARVSETVGREDMLDEISEVLELIKLKDK